MEVTLSENNQNNRNFTSVIKNKRAFFSGLDWKTLPSEEKNARTFARKNDAEYFLSCQYQDSENETKTMVAFIRKEDLPTGASSFWSLALMIKPLIEPDGYAMNRPGFPGECFICELRLPDHRFRWKHNKLFLLLPEEYGPAFPAIVDCYTSPPT
uniref:Pilin accessory protein (PilO) n=1 Tax=Escherichia coli TaxID=562 RepID=A0A1U9XF61_ECOLX|nr:Pilin accessory protein (PilO) [Escherichia coli]